MIPDQELGAQIQYTNFLITEFENAVFKWGAITQDEYDKRRADEGLANDEFPEYLAKEVAKDDLLRHILRLANPHDALLHVRIERAMVGAAQISDSLKHAKRVLEKPIGE